MRRMDGRGAADDRRRLPVGEEALRCKGVRPRFLRLRTRDEGRKGHVQRLDGRARAARVSLLQFHCGRPRVRRRLQIPPMLCTLLSSFCTCFEAARSRCGVWRNRFESLAFAVSSPSPPVETVPFPHRASRPCMHCTPSCSRSLQQRARRERAACSAPSSHAAYLALASRGTRSTE